MKRAIITAAFVGLTACTATPEMVNAQRQKCAQIGYVVDSPDFLACVERGVGMGETTQNAVAGAAVSSALATAIISSAW